MAKLLTKEIEKSLPKIYATEGIPTEEKVVKVKFFSIFSIFSNWTWYAVEGERTEDGDFEFFGLVDGFEREWGYFSMREQSQTRMRGKLKLVERDLYFKPTKIKDIPELKKNPRFVEA